jgi:hypothetical protein
MTISTLDGYLGGITPITLDHVILCAFKVEKYPLFELIIIFIILSQLGFSFRHSDILLFIHCFHIAYVIFGHKHFTSVTVFVSTHVRLSPSVFVHRGGALTATIVCFTRGITLTALFCMQIITYFVDEMSVAIRTILPVFRLILMTFVA